MYNLIWHQFCTTPSVLRLHLQPGSIYLTFNFTIRCIINSRLHQFIPFLPYVFFISISVDFSVSFCVNKKWTYQESIKSTPILWMPSSSVFVTFRLKMKHIKYNQVLFVLIGFSISFQILICFSSLFITTLSPMFLFVCALSLSLTHSLWHTHVPRCYFLFSLQIQYGDKPLWIT